MVLPIIILPLLVVSSLATSPVRPTPTPPVTTPPIKPKPIEALCECNEKYVRNSTECRLTCANRLVQDPCGRCKPYSGCVCKKGFVRLNDDATGPCVTEDQCPPTCPKGEQYVENSNACEKTCSNRDILHLMGACLPSSKCMCSGDLMRLNDDATGPCVSEDQCPPRCGYNEEWTKNKYTCPPEICQSQYILYSCSADGRKPKPGCQCIDGYLRNSSNICIPIKDCPPPPPKCPKNEHYEKNSNVCEKSFSNRKVHHIIGPCETHSSCKCNRGLVRLKKNGPCVTEDQCDPECLTGEHYVNNTNLCEKTCDNRNIFHIMGPCWPFSKCVCDLGLIRLNKDGPCVPEDQCPPSDISCGPNEEWTPHKITCPPEICASQYVFFSCAAPPEDYTPPPGCQCRYGYLRDANDICIPKEECPPPPVLPQCNGPNEVPSENSIRCPPQICESLHKGYACIPREPVPGCVCIEGYLRNDSNICVPSNECPPPPEPEKSCPENEVWSEDKIVCPPQSCASIYSSYNCENVTKTSGCNCIDGYLRDDNEVCIPNEKCSGPTPVCGENEVYSEKKITCPPQSCEAATGLINYLCAWGEPEPGCNCKENHLRDANNVCIPAEQCPPGPDLHILCGPNEEETDKKVECPPETCEAIGRVYRCPVQKPKKGCKCIKGYLRNSKGECIPKDKCEKGSKKCPIPKNCRRTCANRNALDCVPRPPPKHNVDGCECRPGYLLKSVNGKCIPEKDCPKPSCPKNEVFTTCKVECPLHYCPVDDIDVIRGILICEPREPCPSGCVCQLGYMRKSYEEPVCIDASTCPPVNCTRPNEEWNPAPPTCLAQLERCENLVNPKPCISAAVNYVPRCTCKEGFYKNKSNICVPAKECPGYGKCGKNATYKECPTACPGTCEQPNPGRVCNKMCLAAGCECNPGYVLHKGKCIEWKDCPPVTCPANQTYVYCKAGCPTDYCPASDSTAIVACSPPYPCPPGCVCKEGYKKKSQKEPGCIKISDCPPVKCTRPNEVWDPTPPNCIADRCSDLANPKPCDRPYPNYMPQCVCKKGYYRNASSVCIPAKECGIRPCGGNETYSECAAECPNVYCPTTDSRSRFACGPTYPCPGGCICKAGYRRKSIEEKICIKPYDCPPVNCTRPNEEWNPNPPECINDNCEDVLDPPNWCPFPSFGTPLCTCKEGYYRNKSGICVPVMECGIKCPVNQTFVYCNAKCPTDYCPDDDSRDQIACDPPYPCPPGCACKAGYKLKSVNEKICIKVTECTPVTCTRPNEVWNPTPPNCIRDRCEDAVNPQPCDWDYPNYTPQCMCKEGYYRNASDICVPVAECPGYCPVPAQCRPTCAVPNPPNCPASTPSSTNVDGCQCQTGYVLSAEGKCIKIEECPQDQSCNGDPHARIMACPWACPATCDSPQASRCEKKCDPVGCVCESGYIFSKKDGKCIIPDDCPAGDPCGPNGTYVDCGFRCPNQYCPQDDSGVVYACKPGRPCPPGCGCKINYLRKDYDDDRCILASDCPPVECTKPNEVWDSCPSDCLSEQCENVNDPPAVCNTLLLNCQPKCVCQENHYRNSSGICVPASECPIPPSACTSDCTPTCAVPSPPDCPPYTDVKRPCCEHGYILDKKGGKCIPIEDCPKTGCNGDPNAVIRRCPIPCVRSTCAKPESQGCPTACTPGCECAPGYILSDYNGKCIKVEECPGGNPCGPNAHFVNCKSSCPTDYCPVDDNRATIICETYPFAPCFSGCVCNLNHKLNNRAEEKCIVSSDCPPVNCTRPNEVWNSCPSDCQSEYCEAAFKKPVVCNTLVLNCQPRCVCKKNHFRNDKDICIPAKKCPKPKKPCDSD